MYRALDLPPPGRVRESWSVALATRQMRAVGLTVVDARESALVTEFADVGAFAWYLKAVPWAVPAFTIERCQPALERLHDRLRGDSLSIRLPAFLLQATK